jgi:hypothetical protein
MSARQDLPACIVAEGCAGHLQGLRLLEMRGVQEIRRWLRERAA